MATPKRPVRLFVSFADADRADVAELLDYLEPELQISRNFEPLMWASYRNLDVGEGWNAEIAERIATCDLALWLVSPNFLRSSYIRDYEIPPFVGPARRVPGLPVGLHPVPMDGSVDMFGIEKLQMFRLDGRGLDARRCFSECATRTLKRKFAAELAWQIRNILDPPAGKW